MSQANISIPNQTGANFRADLNDALAAIDSAHKGSSAPSDDLAAGRFWIDDAADPTWTLKVYDGSDWISVYQIDTTGNTITQTSVSFDKGSDLASASTLVIGTDGGYFDVTGTTTITAMTVAAGRLFVLQFDSALTLTHGGSLKLPSAANITTAAGDRAIFYATAADTVECLGYATVGGIPPQITFLDEDDLSSDSATAVPSQQSVKAYVDNNSGGVFTASFESANQTITSGGALTLAHGLGAEPKIIQMVLECTSAELGFSVGDKYFINNADSSNNAGTNGQGTATTADATNIYVRFGNNSTSFGGPRKDTGAPSSFTNANWELIVRAYA